MMVGRDHAPLEGNQKEETVEPRPWAWGAGCLIPTVRGV